MDLNIAATETSILCVAILLLIRLTFNRDFLQKPQTTLFKLVIYAFIAFSIVDASSILATKETSVQRFINFFKLISCTFVGFSWFLFVHSVTEHSFYQLRKWFPLILTPLFTVAIVSAIDLIKHFDESEIQLNSAVWIIFNVAMLAYIVSASVIAYAKARKSKNKFIRWQYRYLATIMFIPIIAMGIQAQFINILITPPVFALTILHLYINSIRRQITVDPVTGVNNIHKLAEYLTKLTSKSNPGRRLFYLQIKLDNIRQITKKFGQEKYTEVLCAFARFLQKQSHEKKLFLARSGHDSFAMICECENQSEIETLGNSLAHNSTRDEMQSLLPWEISFSIYWSEYGTEETPTIDSLLNNKTSNCLKPPSPITSH